MSYHNQQFSNVNFNLMDQRQPISDNGSRGPYPLGIKTEMTEPESQSPGMVGSSMPHMPLPMYPHFSQEASGHQAAFQNLNIGHPLLPSSHQPPGNIRHDTENNSHLVSSPCSRLSQSPQYNSSSYPDSSVQLSNDACSSLYGDTGLKVRRRTSKVKEDKICGVCGDRALGFNFDAITCESCKAFFRRNASKGPESFKCSNSEDCRLDSSNRRFCKRCRLKRCFDIGMKKDYILTDSEKAEKRRKIQQNRIVRRLEELGWLPKDMIPSELAQRDLMSEEDICDIEIIFKAYKSSIQVRVEDRQNEHQSKIGINDLVNLAEVSTRRVIAMAKRLEPFRNLPQADQVALLKSGSLELLIIRGILTYNPNKEEFLESQDSQSDAVSTNDVMAGFETMTGSSFIDLARSFLFDLQCDLIELLLLLVICLFSVDRVPLCPTSKEIVDSAQLHYTLLLERYLKTRHTVSEARRLFPLILKKLCTLRELNESFTRELKVVDPNNVRPLMTELFDLKHLNAASSASATVSHCSASPASILETSSQGTTESSASSNTSCSVSGDHYSDCQSTKKIPPVNEDELLSPSVYVAPASSGSEESSHQSRNQSEPMDAD